MFLCLPILVSPFGGFLVSQSISLRGERPFPDLPRHRGRGRSGVASAPRLLSALTSLEPVDFRPRREGRDHARQVAVPGRALETCRREADSRTRREGRRVMRVIMMIIITLITMTIVVIMIIIALIMIIIITIMS